MSDRTDRKRKLDLGGSDSKIKVRYCFTGNRLMIYDMKGINWNQIF